MDQPIGPNTVVFDADIWDDYSADAIRAAAVPATAAEVETVFPAVIAD